MSSTAIKALGVAVLAGAVSATASAAGIQNYNAVSEARLQNPEPHNWLMIRGNYEGWGHSSLSQINTSNVQSLRPVWSYSTGVVEGHQAPPIVNDGVMFVTTPQSQVFAMDATTGELLWKYKKELPEDLFQLHPTNRGPALLDNKLYLAAYDGILVALDARTGEELWQSQVADYKAGYYMTLAPLVAKGKVLVGVSGGEYGIRGYVAAYDAETGKEAWRTYTVPAPGEPGSDTWPKGEEWKTGGGSTWMTGNYDPDTGYAYWGVGNAAPWMGDTRGGLDNLYTTSVIALDVPTGKIVGHHQYHWNDSWDWDEVSPPIIREVTMKGRTFKALVNVARNGHIYVLEPTAEGPIKFIDAWNYVYTNVVKSMDPQTGRFTYNESAWPGTNKKAKFCPSLWGGKDWPPAAYNPDTGLMYIPANENICSTLEGATEKYVPGELYIGVPIPVILGGFSLREGWQHIGEIQAWDINNKKEAWTRTFKHHNWGPITSTGGNLIFAGGTNDRMFRAFDATSGSLLWEYPTNSGITAPPSTFMVDGKQYIAVQSGWGVDAERKQDVFRNIIPGYSASVPQGGVIWVFALP
ncbi:MAG: PQQ-dependent dehydrogenase, methanol/ethanol family [Pseudomonadota bacterium]